MNIKNIFKKDINSNLVYIVGIPRSGTTWVWGMLTSHPSIISLVREDFFPNEPSIKNKKRITSETGAFIRIKDDKKIKKIILNKIKNHPNKIIIEKTPTHITQIKRILKLFPNAKIIHVIRDPRAVISSMLNSHFFKFANNLDDAINKCISYYQFSLEFENYSNFYILKYEDLIKRPQDTLRKLFKFLNLKTSNLDKIIKENKNVSKVKLKDVFRKGKIDSYKKELSKKQIAQIEAETFDIMKKYGYLK